MTYNGWANYATWNINLWATNEPGWCSEYEDAARRGPRALREWVEDEMLSWGAMNAGPVQDLLGSVLDDVDWDELCSYYAEEEEEEEEGDEGDEGDD
jgi:hypothetical protein